MGEPSGYGMLTFSKKTNRLRRSRLRSVTRGGSPGLVSVGYPDMGSDGNRLMRPIGFRSSESLSNCSSAGEIGVEDIKKSTGLVPLTIPRLSKTKVTQKGRVPRISGDTEDYLTPAVEEETVPVAAPRQRRSPASVPTEKTSSTRAPGKKRSSTPAATDRSSVVSILLEKRLADSLAPKAPSSESAGAKDSSPAQVPAEDRSSVSALLERRLAASVRREEPSPSPASSRNTPQSPAVRRGNQHNEHTETVKSAACRVRDGSSTVEARPPAVPRAPILLKVIRRRGEQAPKVLETVASGVPKAMLKGVKVNPEEDFEGPFDE
ncbi:MAG: hypothetical protein RDU20_08625 [Desulfomonilaceae bacterium]|nr:hypothetical protein [Desulfomonilaceae bacterium]